MLSYVRQAISANGGTPQSFRPIDAWRELVTVYGGTPTQYTQIGLMRQAVTAVGGTPTQWTELGLLRELLTALGVSAPSYSLRALYQQLAGATTVPTDTTAPILSLPTGVQTSPTTATIGATTDEGAGLLYWVVTTSATTPTASQIETGQSNSGTAAAASGTVTVGSAGAKTANATGLSPSTAYYAHLVQTDLALNTSNVVSSAQFTTAAAPDVTAPTLSSPTDAANGSTGGTLSVSTDEANGTLYWFISTSATPPTAANLKAGTGAVSYGSQAVTATGVQNVSATGLAASTAYFSYFLHRDATGNDSTIAAADGFTTTSLTAPVLTRTSAAGANPMTWSGAYTGMVVGTSYISMRWRVNGGSWTNETDHLVTSDDAFDMGDGTATFAWPLYDAHTFSAGDFVEVEEGHTLSGTTAWSSILSDTMAGAATYAHGGKATSASSSTAVSFTALPFAAGKALVVLTCFSNAGGTVDSVPTSLTLTPTGGGTPVTLTKVGSGGTSAARAFAVYATSTNITAGNYDVTGTRPAAARSNVLFYGALTGNSTPTSGPTFTASSETNPHATSSATCPTNGIVMGWFMLVNSATLTASTGTTLIDQTFFNSECGLAMGTRADTGSISVTASPNSTFNWGRGVAAFQP